MNVRNSQVVAAALVAAFLLSACTSQAGGGPAGPKRGGSLVLGAEYWPDCINPVTFCAGAFWAQYAVFEHVLPRAMELDPQGNYVASPLLVRAPTLANGLLTEDPFTVTYEINPKAVWDDGSPITSADIAFTWHAILNTKGSFFKTPAGAPPTAYDQIASIDTANQRTAIVRFKDLLLQWQELFGGFQGFILKKAAFPNADPEKPDLSGDMLGSIPFSGGPWRLQLWNLHEAVLVPNLRYWALDRRPWIDRVTFVAIRAGGSGEDPAEYAALRDGEVSAIYPMPVTADILHQLAGPQARAVGADGNFVNALWFNVQRAPMNDIHVRQAVMYAIDRQVILDSTAKLNNSNARVLNCGLLAIPKQGPWCANTYFGGVTYDPARSLRILRDDGWNCPNGAKKQPCSKGGRPLVLEIAALVSNPRYVTAQALVRQEAKAAGIGLRFTNYTDARKLFTDVLPHGRFDITQYDVGPVTDPTVTALFACDQIPTAANGYVGGNWNRWCNREADQLMKQSDRELDPKKRVALLEQVYALEAKDAVALPLNVDPNVAAWRTDQVGGPVGLYISSFYGIFFNMYDWYVP